MRTYLVYIIEGVGSTRKLTTDFKEAQNSFRSELVNLVERYQLESILTEFRNELEKYWEGQQGPNDWCWNNEFGTTIAFRSRYLNIDD